MAILGRFLLPFPCLCTRFTSSLPLLFSFAADSPLPSLRRTNHLLAAQTSNFRFRSLAILADQPPGGTLDLHTVLRDDEDDEFCEEDEKGGDEEDVCLGSAISSESPLSLMTLDRVNGKLPILTVKEKKDLASYAHSLGKKLKSQQVGKSGVTEAVAASLVETLEKNELLKLKVHNSCPGELVDVIRQLEEATSSVVVGQIDRTVILYRPSISKLKAAEKKRQATVNRKRYIPKSGFPKRQGLGLMDRCQSSV